MFQPLLKFAIPVVGQYDLLLVPNTLGGIKLYLVRHLVQVKNDAWKPTPGPLGGPRPSAVPFQFPNLYNAACWDKAVKPPWWGYAQKTPAFKASCKPVFLQVPALVQVQKRWATNPQLLAKPFLGGWGPWQKWFEDLVGNDSYRAKNFEAGTTWWISDKKPLVLLQTNFFPTSGSFGNPITLGDWGVSISLNGSMIPLSLLPGGAPNKLRLEGGVASIKVPGAGGFEVHDVTAEYMVNMFTKSFPYPLYRMKFPSMLGDFINFPSPGLDPQDLGMLALRLGANLNPPFLPEDVPPGGGGSYYIATPAATVQFMLEAE